MHVEILKRAGVRTKSIQSVRRLKRLLGNNLVTEMLSYAEKSHMLFFSTKKNCRNKKKWVKFSRGLHSLGPEISGDLSISRFLKKSLATPTVGAESRTNFRGRRVLGHLLSSHMWMTHAWSSSGMTRSQGGLQVPLVGGRRWPQENRPRQCHKRGRRGPQPTPITWFPPTELNGLENAWGKAETWQPYSLSKYKQS